MQSIQTVKVVNSYAPTEDAVLVTLERSVDFPTEGNPMSATLASVLHHELAGLPSMKHILELTSALQHVETFTLGAFLVWF